MYSVALLAFLPAILAKPYPRQATTAADGTLYIHPNGNTNFCLGTYGAYNSAPVDIFDCSTKTAATPSWSLDSSRRRFQLNGTNFCLDAGSNIGDGVSMKLWQCYDNLPQQQWSYNSGDQHFSVATGAECLDLRDGALYNGGATQTWQCSSPNPNQKWTLTAAQSGTGTSSSASQSASGSASGTSSGTASSASPSQTPTQQGQALHPNGNNGKCLDVQGNVQANGTPVDIYDCNGTSAQQWVLTRGSTAVRLANTNFCLDAGSNIGNQVGMKLWQCYSGLAQQTWYYTDDNRIAVQGYGQCLDLTGGRLDNGNIVQTWTCTDGNTNQIWN
ncbi:ricin B lectin domain-containing protein [Schizophyllum commune]